MYCKLYVFVVVSRSLQWYRVTLSSIASLSAAATFRASSCIQIGRYVKWSPTALTRVAVQCGHLIRPSIWPTYTLPLVCIGNWRWTADAPAMHLFSSVPSSFMASPTARCTTSSSTVSQAACRAWTSTNCASALTKSMPWASHWRSASWAQC